MTGNLIEFVLGLSFGVGHVGVFAIVIVYSCMSGGMFGTERMGVDDFAIFSVIDLECLVKRIFESVCCGE